MEQDRNPTARLELLACNALSRCYGLSLGEADVRELEVCREQALLDAGRVEFGGGVLPKLVRAFCDSPFLEQQTYVQTLAELQEAFYFFKSESMERFSDDELIGFMVQIFNGRAQGSAEYLTGTSLEELCRWAREGWDPHSAAQAEDLF